MTTKRYQRTPEQIYRYNRTAYCKAKFGMTPEAYDAFVSARPACEICATELGQDAATRPCVDHNHTTGKVRGVLCGRCNKGIGLLQDSPAVLRAAIEYLNDRGHYGRREETTH